MFEAVLSVQILIPGNSIYPPGLIGAPIQLQREHIRAHNNKCTFRADLIINLLTKSFWLSHNRLPFYCCCCWLASCPPHTSHPVLIAVLSLVLCKVPSIYVSCCAKICISSAQLQQMGVIVMYSFIILVFFYMYPRIPTSPSLPWITARAEWYYYYYYRDPRLGSDCTGLSGRNCTWRLLSLLYSIVAHCEKVSSK